MDVRERDDTLDWDEELPGGFSFLDDDPVEPLPRPRRGRTLRMLLVLALLVTAVGFGFRWTSESDLRALVTASTQEYATFVARVRLAQDPPGLSRVLAGAPTVAAELETQLAAFDRGSDRRRIVAEQVAAERDMVLALGALSGLEAEPLAVWGEAHPDLAEAAQREARSRARFDDVAGGAAERLPDSEELVVRVSTIVGGALVADVQRAAHDLLAGLATAQRTADLRAAAEQAPGQRAAVLAAVEGVRGTGKERVLEAFAEALASLSDLRTLRPDALVAWPGARETFGTSLGVVGDADASFTAGSVRARLPLVLTHLDGVVQRAADAYAAWVPVRDAALAAQARDAAAVGAYTQRLAEWTATQQQLRTDLERLDLQGPQAVLLPELEGVTAQAAALRDTLRAVQVPTELAPAHARLAQHASAVADALQRSVTAVAAIACADCPDAGAAAYDDLRDAMQQSANWAALVRDAEAARVAAEQAVANRPMPPMPDA